MSLGSITNLPRPLKALILILVDACLASAAFWLAAIARYGRISNLPAEQILIGMALVALLVPLLAMALGLYKSMTRFFSPQLPARAGVLCLVAGTILGLIGWVGDAPPLRAASLGFVFALVLFALILLSRTAARRIIRGPTIPGTPVAIYGAGDAGRQLAAVLMRGDGLRPVTFLDEDRQLWGRSVEDLPVLNPKDARLPERLRSRGVREVLIAIPSLSPSRRRELLERLSALALRVRSVPALDRLVERSGQRIGDLTEITVEDLLGRDPVTPLPGLLESCIRGKTILVTGGGGSIGSELCRQALSLGPAKLIVMDHSELALYEIEMDLRHRATSGGSSSGLAFVLGSVADRSRLGQLFGAHAVDTVYHAAAYKHVPIVELNAVEGFRNNVLGTWHLARAAAAAGTRHFVLISSDKAVRPTSVMGASKRCAELVVDAVSAHSPGSVFSMVRFGNVLASSGSVVPLFRKQIADGGPVTLTHPDVTRYFMTIPEAVELVIQAGAMAQGGELFVLEMGAPVRIGELAERMIRLSGMTVRDHRNPNGDVAIEVTGLRPGEKLFEELLIDGDISGTLHPRILRMNERAIDTRAFESELAAIDGLGHDESAAAAVRRFLAKWVSGYREVNDVGASGQLRVVGTEER